MRLRYRVPAAKVSNTRQRDESPTACRSVCLSLQMCPDQVTSYLSSVHEDLVKRCQYLDLSQVGSVDLDHV